MHIGYVPRERLPFSALNFRSGAYHFHKLQKIRSGASPFYIFWRISTRSWRILPFRRPSFSKFLKFQPVHHLPRPAQPRVSSRLRVPARRVLVVPETSIFTLKTDQARSGAPHFQVQNGSSSFRSPSFSRSTGSSFRSPCPIFTLPRHIPTKKIVWAVIHKMAPHELRDWSYNLWRLLVMHSKAWMSKVCKLQTDLVEIRQGQGLYKDAIMRHKCLIMKRS